MKRQFFIIIFATSMCAASAHGENPSWLYTGYAKTTQWFSNRTMQASSFLKTTQQRAGSLLTALASYFPSIVRKHKFEQGIKAFETAMTTLDKANTDSDAYFKKIEDMAKVAAQKASPSKSVKNTLPTATEIIETDNDDYDGGGSCMFNYAGPSDLPTAALEQSPSKQLHRRLTTRDSLRNMLEEIKKKNPQESPSATHLLPARIQAALGYLGNRVQENIDTYQQIIDNERIFTITIPHEGIDIQTGQLITHPYNLLEEYECPAYGKPMVRTIDYKDIPLICGLTKKGKKYKTKEDFFENNPDAAGYNLYKLEQTADDDLMDVQDLWSELKDNLQFFDRKKAQDYCDPDKHPELLNGYIAQQQRFMEENKNFRKGFVDVAGTTHKGWITILAEEKTALENQQKKSAQRWYLW